MSRPDYEALGADGLPYIRKAQVVEELPTPQQRLHALGSATATLATLLGIKARKPIAFGVPVHVAFGLTRQQARHHAHADLLLTAGCALNLDYAYPPEDLIKDGHASATGV